MTDDDNTKLKLASAMTEAAGRCDDALGEIHSGLNALMEAMRGIAAYLGDENERLKDELARAQ